MLQEAVPGAAATTCRIAFGSRAYQARSAGLTVVAEGSSGRPFTPAHQHAEVAVVVDARRRHLGSTAAL